MSNFSKSYEPDENRSMNEGLIHSLVGALLCWLPLVGLFLAISGFLRVIIQVTQAHRAKKGATHVLTLLILAGCIGAPGTGGILLRARSQRHWTTARKRGVYALTRPGSRR